MAVAVSGFQELRGLCCRECGLLLEQSDLGVALLLDPTGNTLLRDAGGTGEEPLVRADRGGVDLALCLPVDE